MYTEEELDLLETILAHIVAGELSFDPPVTLESLLSHPMGNICRRCNKSSHTEAAKETFRVCGRCKCTYYCRSVSQKYGAYRSFWFHLRTNLIPTIDLIYCGFGIWYLVLSLSIGIGLQSGVHES